MDYPATTNRYTRVYDADGTLLSCTEGWNSPNPQQFDGKPLRFEYVSVTTIVCSKGRVDAADDTQ